MPSSLPSEAPDKPEAPPAETKRIEDAALIDAIVRVCKGKVSKPEALGRLPVFRAAMAEGIDFFEDILPKLEGFARRQKHVENCANRHVIDDARKHAELRKAAATLPSPAGTVQDAPTMRVYRDDPAHAGILDAVLVSLNRSRKAFLHNDARGSYGVFRKDEWERAVAITRDGGASP